MKKQTQDDSETATETTGKSEQHRATSKKIEKPKSQEDIREGRKSLTMPKSYGGKNKIRYIEGTKALKDGCWLSDK